MTMGGLALAPKNSVPRRSTEASPLPLEISTLVVADTAVARLRGDLDHATAPQLRTWAARALGVGARNLVIDCAEITFLDCGALRLLLELARATHQRSGYLTIRHCTPAVRRIFEITGMVDSLGVEPPPTP
jgi:anti-anti-sigma factor